MLDPATPPPIHLTVRLQARFWSRYGNKEEFCGEFGEGVLDGVGVANLGGKAGVYEGEWAKGARHGWAVTTLDNQTMWAGQLSSLCKRFLGAFSKLYIAA